MAHHQSSGPETFVDSLVWFLTALGHACLWMGSQAMPFLSFATLAVSFLLGVARLVEWYELRRDRRRDRPVKPPEIPRQDAG